ncbi:MAG: EEP domain-containing protein [Methylophilaceae bacterium]|nr:EEP domain-containing protein [Methylophilaceae bacterium]
MHNTLRIATFNIHKGVTSFNARFSLHEQRELIRKLHADIVFLQEVRDVHAAHSKRFATWPEGGQAEFLADTIWPDYAYGKNAVYPGGHHGNVLLSKYPIIKATNEDISAHAVEQRGMLHCEVRIPGWDQDLHCICLHLGLFARWRRQQMFALRERIESTVPPSAPLIIAGDFNDWRMKAGNILKDSLHLKEAFEHTGGKPARSFPSVLPLLRMDRIYVRGFRIQHTDVHSDIAFARVSDHAALSAILTKL